MPLKNELMDELLCYLAALFCLIDAPLSFRLHPRSSMAAFLSILHSKELLEHSIDSIS